MKALRETFSALFLSRQRGGSTKKAKTPRVRIAGAGVGSSGGDQGAVDIQGSVSDHVIVQLSRFQFMYSLIGMILGVICMIGGIVLCLASVGGATDWSIKILQFNSKLAKAAPGVMLFVAGVVITYVTSFRVRVLARTSAAKKGKSPSAEA
jgi:hypothetical protein